MSKEDQNRALAIATRAAKNARPQSLGKAIVEALHIEESKRPFKRPLAKDADKTISRQQPWIKEGMSRASWYRRLSEQRRKKEQEK